MARIWERLKNETDPAWEAFVLYRDMGVQRTRKAVGKHLGKHVQGLQLWASEFKWVERARAWDAEKDKVRLKGELSAIEDMRKRQVQLALTMQQIAGQELLKMAKAARDKGEQMTLDPDVVLKLVKEGTTLERLNRGEPSSIVVNDNTTVTANIDYTKLTTEELRALREMKRKLESK